MLFAVQSTASLAADPKIGNATNTKNSVQGVVGSNTQNLSKGSELYANETVRTGGDSADLQFIDQSNLTVGPISEIRLDKFVYDPSGSAGSVVIQATRGAFRFVTGSQEEEEAVVPAKRVRPPPEGQRNASLSRRDIFSAAKRRCPQLSGYTGCIMVYIARQRSRADYRAVLIGRKPAK
jgi:hypothetical protein